MQKAKETTNAVVLAAGLSSRMGEFKPLLEIDGLPMIVKTVKSVIEGGADQIVVVTGFRQEDIVHILESYYPNRIQFVYNPYYRERDMFYSVKLGIESLGECQNFFLLPADMPAVKKSTFDTLTRANCQADEIVFPTLDHYRKHPPLIGEKLKESILSFSGEGGLRELWKLLPDHIREVEVNDKGVWVDLDTQEDYIRYQKNSVSFNK